MNERYEIRKKIGQGGIGAVYKAFDTKLQRKVAIKRLLPLAETKENRDAEEGLKKEAALISSLQSPNIITVYDAGSDDEGVFVVMELIEGQTLDRIVRTAALRENDFILVVEQSLGGLIAAHAAGLLHRDLKPKNIMVAWLPSGNFQLKILDFGLAKFSVKPSLQTVDHADNILGSIHFMAPEQFERLPLDPRTDLYAMGCVYYFALTQKHPFTGDTPAEVMSSHLSHHVKPLQHIRKDINPHYCDWIMRLISRNPQDRPKDARAALQEFKAIDTGPVTLAALPITSAPMAVTIPAIEESPTTLVHATGPVTAAQRTKRKDSAPIAAAVTLVSPPPAKPPSRSHAKAILYTSLALIPLLALIAFALFHDSSSSGSNARPDMPALPLARHRIAHFAADHGVLTSDNKTIAATGDRVGRWDDFSANRSRNYFFTPPSPDNTLKPTLATAGPPVGLNRQHRVIRFRKGETLVADRDRDSAANSFGKSFDSSQLSWFVVFQPATSANDHRLFSMDVAAFPDARVTRFRHKSYQSGARQKGTPDRLSSAPCNLGKFILLTTVWNGDIGKQYMHITTSNGTRVVGSLEKVSAQSRKIVRLRLGGTKSPAANPNSLFAGDIAELIIYNKALSERDIKIVETYLKKKYFGF